MPSPADQNSPASPDPRESILDIVRAIRRNLVRVVFTTLVFLMLGIAVNMVWPNKYESSTEFALLEAKIVTDAAVLGELEDMQLQKKLQALKGELKSTARVSSVMDELQWKIWLETAGQPAARRRLIAKIKDNLEIEMSANVTGAINVTMTFQWTSPRDAMDFVNRLRDSWIKLVLDSYRKGVDNRREEAEQRKLEREQEYQAALAARQKYEEENDVPGLLDLEQNIRLRADLLLRQTDARAQLEAVVSRIQFLRAEMLTLPKTQLAPAPAASPEQAVAMSDLITARAAFAEAEAKYRPGHWRYDIADRAVQAAVQRVEELGGLPEEEFVESLNPVYVSKATELEGQGAKELELRTVISDLDAQIRRVDENLLRLPGVEADLARLSKDIELAERLLSEAAIELRPLRDQATQVRAINPVVGSSANLISTSPFEILEVGIEPDAPVLPVGAIIMALSLLLGIGLGLSGPVLTEVTRNSFGSVKEVSRTLGVPVLGAVDLILTTRDMRARTVQSLLSITTMVLVLLALGTALYMYANHQDRLPAELLRAVKNIRMSLL